MHTSVLRHHHADSGPTPAGRWITSPQSTRAYQWRARGRASGRPAVPGFRAYLMAEAAVTGCAALPGFETRSYRDFGHSGGRGGVVPRTGISGTPLPGVGAYDHRELRHGATGNWGTPVAVRTGNPGTTGRSKPLERLTNASRNFVLMNLKETQQQQGVLLFSSRGGR